jgi:zinc transport system substrate-binding protein
LYLVPQDIDPAYWEPTDADITKMQQADLVLLNGASYEKWQNSVELPISKIVDSSSSCKSMFIEIKEVMKHEHNGKVHSHDGIDFNIWLDAYIFCRQAETITSALSKTLPQHKALYEKNLKSLKAEVMAVFMQFNKVAGDQKKFLASHPVYEYLGKANGWEIQSFHWEPNVMPSAEEWNKLKSAAAFSKYMLYEDTPSAEIAAKLTEIGIQVIVFRTCGNTPPTKDFLKEMKENLKRLERVFKK